MATQVWSRLPRSGARLTSLLVWLGLALSSPAGPLGAAPAVCLPLAIRVAQRDGAPVAGAGFVGAQVERANQIYARYGVQFSATLGPPLPSARAELVTREDRDALAPFVAPGAINVFVVAALMDVDEPGRVRRGVHWRARHQPRATHFVILSAIAEPNVLAHELGHFLGNPQHSEVTGNLMSYMHTDELPVLDRDQLTRIDRAIRRYRASGEIGRPPRTAAPCRAVSE